MRRAQLEEGVEHKKDRTPIGATQMVPQGALFLPTRLLASGNRCLVKNANWILLHFVRRAKSDEGVRRKKMMGTRLAPPRWFTV